MTDITDLAKEVFTKGNNINPDTITDEQMITRLSEIVVLAEQLAQMVIDLKPCFAGIDWAKDYLDEVREKARQEQKEKDANLVYTYALQAGASSRAYVTFTESKHLLAIAQEIWES